MQMSVNHSNVLIPWSEGKLCFWGSCQHHLHVHLHDFCQSLFCSRHSWEPFWGEKGEPSVPENYFHNNFINSQGNLFFLSLLSPVHYVNTKFLKWWQELSRNAWNIHTMNSSQHREMALGPCLHTFLKEYLMAEVWGENWTAKPWTQIKSLDYSFSWWNKG